MKGQRKPIPVILDTDIGGDIDDTWALALMLRSPELDVKLVVSDTGDTRYRAKIIAKMLEVAGRTDVRVGIGLPSDAHAHPQAPWVQDYDLRDYGGTLHEDGAEALIQTIMNAPEPVTLVCIGPVPNIREALKREPRIARNARFVGMFGSVYKGHEGSAEPAAEYNVKQDVAACRAAFAAPWGVTLTPLDTCGVVALKGEKYQAVRHCRDPLVQALMDNYRIWADSLGRPEQFDHRSSVLFDTVAVYLAFSEELLVMRELGIRVTDDGHTVADETARKMRVAVDWRNLEAFEDLLVRRLID
jgi:inosine-uridine nucleoside N-ribohydrolase